MKRLSLKNLKSQFWRVLSVLGNAYLQQDLVIVHWKCCIIELVYYMYLNKGIASGARGNLGKVRKFDIRTKPAKTNL